MSHITVTIIAFMSCPCPLPVVRHEHAISSEQQFRDAAVSLSRYFRMHTDRQQPTGVQQHNLWYVRWLHCVASDALQLVLEHWHVHYGKCGIPVRGAGAL